LTSINTYGNQIAVLQQLDNISEFFFF